MNCSRSWTDESGTTPTNPTSKHRKETGDNQFEEKNEQILVHRWFLSDIRSLNEQEQGHFLQSTSFGCTGENGLLEWIIRFYPVAPIDRKDSSSHGLSEKTSPMDHPRQDIEPNNLSFHASRALFNALQQIISNNGRETPLPSPELLIEENDKANMSPPILTRHALENVPGDSVRSSAGESSSPSSTSDQCAFEVLRINTHEQPSRTLFETIYQVFEVADNGHQSLLRTQGRHQVQFDRALIRCSRDTIFAIESNNILFSVKLIVYECSSTVDYWQPLADTQELSPLVTDTTTSIKRPPSNMSGGDAKRFCRSHFSNGDISWLMSTEKLFTDLILRSSDGVEFHVHRIVLFSSCEILMNSPTDQIDLPGSILERTLKYIYTGQIDEFSLANIRAQIHATNLFGLFPLKNILIKNCLNHITQENCLELLQIADEQQLKILQYRVLAFLSGQYSKIFNTKIWQDLRQTVPHLYDEAFLSLIRLTRLQTSIIERLQGSR